MRTFVEPVDASTSVTTSFGYAEGGLLTRQTDGRGNGTVYTYNSLNLREAVSEPPTAAHPAFADREWIVSYDAGGLPVSVAAPGGVTVAHVRRAGSVDGGDGRGRGFGRRGAGAGLRPGGAVDVGRTTRGVRSRSPTTTATW